MIVNGNRHRLDVEPATPLLWTLRARLGLTGTKYGCGVDVLKGGRIVRWRTGG